MSSLSPGAWDTTNLRVWAACPSGLVLCPSRLLLRPSGPLLCHLRHGHSHCCTRLYKVSQSYAHTCTSVIGHRSTLKCVWLTKITQGSVRKCLEYTFAVQANDHSLVYYTCGYYIITGVLCLLFLSSDKRVSVQEGILCSKLWYWLWLIACTVCVWELPALVYLNIDSEYRLRLTLSY